MEKKFTISDVIKVLKKSIDEVGVFVKTFSKQLSLIDPEKYKDMHYSLDDISRLVYISDFWESNDDDPNTDDIIEELENYEYKKNNEYTGGSIFDDVKIQVLPIIREYENEVDGWLIGGSTMRVYEDLYMLAESYRRAGDTLVDAWLSEQEEYWAAYPTMYNYRHAIELYLKYLFPEEASKKRPTHDLNPLKKNLIKALGSEEKNAYPNFIGLIDIYEKYSPSSTEFRFGASTKKDSKLKEENELIVEPLHLKNVVEKFAGHIKDIKDWIATKTK